MERKAFKIAVTGTVCTGKSFVLGILERFGLPTFNFDMEVKKIYQDKAVIYQISSAFPSAVRNGVVDTKTLGDIVFKQTPLLDKLEGIIYPPLFKAHDKFLENNKGKSVVALEVPLLYQKNLEDNYDAVILTVVDMAIQEERAQKRGITIERLNEILDLQLPNEGKKADYIVDTNISEHDMRKRLSLILNDVRAKHAL
jgi:dephospho-CoA kinase